MKKVVLLSMVLFPLYFIGMSTLNAQGVGINPSGNLPDPSAGLDINFTNKGTLITRMTTAQRDAIVSPAKGLQIYNTDCDNFNYNAGTPIAPNWVPANPPLNLPSAAGTISGTAAICQGQSNVSYSVPAIINATSYIWSYSGTGVTISGSTNPMIINFSGSATSGELSVIGNNACGNGAASANYSITVSPNVAASVNIAASPSGAICAGTSVTFTATSINGGTSPSFQWKLNGGNVGSNSTTYSNSTLANGDIITCVLTSNATCVTGSPATSNQITMAVNPVSHSSMTFTYTGSQQTFTVPSCINLLTIDAYGAQGQDGTYGGKGGQAKGTLAVTQGQVLYVFVGASGTNGGWNGGGFGSYQGGMGAGASDVRSGGTALSNRVIVAGGGGGMGSNGGCPGTSTLGGVGGGNTGATGTTNSTANGGVGGNQSNGGSGGSGALYTGTSGSLGLGGNDGGCGCSGGGGGGYYGGGGGGSTSGCYRGGGGGGSNYLGGVTLIANAQNVQTGDGKVIITW